jgi:hypothetical protein
MAGLQRVTNNIKFRNKVSRVITYLELEEPRWFQLSPHFADDTEFIEDGQLHITRSGLQVVFDVSNGQTANAAEQNRQVRRIMEHLNMKRKIKSLLVNDNSNNKGD